MGMFWWQTGRIHGFRYSIAPGNSRPIVGEEEKGRVLSTVDGAGALYVGVRKADYDPPSNGILKLDREWRTVAAIGFGGPVFNAVHDIAVAKDGTIYVAETRTKRVVKLRPR